MPKMKVIQISSPGANFELNNIEIPEPKANEVLIKIEACGVCHGDAMAKDGHFPGIKYPIIPGHEVIGTIAKLGSPMEEWQVGQRVGVGWHGGHCFKCSACRRGDFGACEKSLTTGLSVNGGYAEYMVSRTEAVVKIPEELNSIEGAPLMCAGRTVFGALKESGAQGGDLVAIHGLGGLGHLAVRYAAKLGFKTVAISRGQEKTELARKLGAHIYIDANASDAAKELVKLGGARAIICTAPSGQAIAGLISGLGRHGRAIIVTGANDPIQIPPFSLLGGEHAIQGFVGGNIDEAINFSLLNEVMPMVEVFPLEKAAQAFEKMMSSKVLFRAVLQMGN
jgi:propanol-preferring alcohol dehydrogenase